VDPKRSLNNYNIQVNRWSEISWVQIAVEAVAIVTSILLAFYIDAWWKQQQDLLEEEKILASLRNDFEASRNLVSFARNEAARKKKSVERLLILASARNPDYDEEEIDRDLHNLGWWITQDLVISGSFNSIISSGTLQLIQSGELRQDVADWPRYLNSVITLLRQDFDAYTSVIQPYIRSHGYLAQIDQHFQVREGYTDYGWAPVPYSESLRINHSAMLEDLRFVNLLTEQLWIQREVEVTLAELNDFLDHEIDLIDSELVRFE